MNDYYLKTETEAEMLAALLEVGAVDADSWGATTPAPGVALDVLGHWFERTGGTNEEPIMTQVPGWHFNVRSVEPIQWPASVTVTSPVTPWRVWG